MGQCVQIHNRNIPYNNSHGGRAACRVKRIDADIMSMASKEREDVSSGSNLGVM